MGEHHTGVNISERLLEAAKEWDITDEGMYVRGCCFSVCIIGLSKAVIYIVESMWLNHAYVCAC